MTAELRNNRRVKDLASTLRQACAGQGVELPPGDSAERIVADRVQEMATTLGLTTRTVLDRYISADSMQSMAQTIAGQWREMAEVLDDAAPVRVGAKDGFMVLAAFGMCASVALRNLDKRDDDPLIVIRDASDSTVHMGVALATSTQEPAEIGGLTLAIARKVITMVLGNLRTGGWDCTCGKAHRADGGCLLQDRLTADLAALGGWAPNLDER